MSSRVPGPPASARLLLLPWLICLCLFITAPEATAASSVPAAPSQNATSAQEDALSHIWSARASDIAGFVDEAGELQANAENLAKPLAESLQRLRAQFTRLSGLFQASRGHPTEQLTLVQQMHGLQNSLKNSIRPLQTIAATVNQRLDEIAALQNDMNALSKESAAGGAGMGSAADSSDELANYTKTLSDARKKLSAVSTRLKRIMAPSRVTLDRINQIIAGIEENLVGVWREYYLTPSANTLSALTSSLTLLADWASSLYSRMGFAYPQSFSEWRGAAATFTAYFAAMLIVAYLALRGTRTLPSRWRRAWQRVIKRAWFWIAVGWAMLMASTNQNGGVYFGFSLAGSLIIIAGVASMSWRLRIAVLPSLEWQPSPLTRLYIPAAIGVFMLFSDLPTRILGIAWGLVMLVFLAMIVSLNRKHKVEGKLPLLELLAYQCAFWFGLASLLVDVAGYARLAILVFMLLFALVNTVILGNALMALFDILADRLFDKTAMPVRNAIARAVGTPVSWVASLVCTVPWLWAVPGAQYLIEQAMSTSYTVGEASFDFSRLAIVVVLFFLFRSFISLGKTSMAHLPERVPNIERGVLPPLTTMMTYGTWTLFALITLGILGVNFTSLAVVAGGLSVGIGFGMQNIFNNLVSGLMLIFGRTILVGDYVDVGGTSGTVRAINIRSTTIETPERALVYVPNSSLMAGQFTNWTRNSRMVRRSIAVGVAYGTDTALVTQLLLEAAANQPNVLKKPAPMALFTNFGDSSLDFTLNVFIDNFDNATSALSALRLDIERLFREHGIAIPYPQLTLHTAQEGGAPAAAPGAAPVERRA